MNYILNEHIALRSWWLVPYAYYIKNSQIAKGLKKEEFEFLLKCDGNTNIEENELVSSFLAKCFISACNEEKSLTQWQKHKSYDNRYFPKMNWMITGKCNYNCLHCFNAADNSPLMAEWSLEDAMKLILEAKECGVNAFTITGGEPMLHKNFFDIIAAIYENGMFVEELNTNGHFINREALLKLKELGSYPLIKISFDGVGHHDWLRNKKGAEKIALDAIKLCKEMGFRVKAQTNVHRLNVESMLPTAKLLNSLGVEEMRIIRTTEAPRWTQNAGDSCLTLVEYFDTMLEFCKEYSKLDANMIIDIWQFLTLFPRSKSYFLRAKSCTEAYRDSIPVCQGNRGMIAVAAGGEVYPCHQMSGYYIGHGWKLGNVIHSGLKPLLQSGQYLNEVCTTVGTLKKNNSKCDECKYFKYCIGGCRAIGLALTGDKFGRDISKCLFFENDYYHKVEKAIEVYTNRSKMDI